MPATYEPIATTTLGSAAADVTFSNIPGTYTDLVVVAFSRCSRTNDNYDGLAFQLNGDTATNYSDTYLLGDGTSASSGRSTNTGAGSIGRLSTSANSFASFDVAIGHFMNYSNTTTNKTILGRTTSMGEFYEVAAYVSLWRSTSAITSIKLFPAVAGGNFVSGSIFSLYGIKSF